MPRLDLAGIKARLPHREPILLVGEVVDWEKDSRIETTRFFAENDPVFAGHFPGHPIVPGMLSVEAMAQSAGLLVNLSLGLMADETLFYFLAVENVRFKKPVLPGDTLRMVVGQKACKAGIYKFEGHAFVGDDVAVDARFSAKLIVKGKH